MTELIKQCLALTKGERHHMVRILTESLTDIPDDGKVRFDQLVRVANETLAENILRKTKEHKVVVGRWMVAYQMKKEGHTYSSIARLMRKNHSTIIYMIKMMENVFDYPQYFKLEQAYWIEFNRKHDEIYKRTDGDSVAV